MEFRQNYDSSDEDYGYDCDYDDEDDEESDQGSDDQELPLSKEGQDTCLSINDSYYDPLIVNQTDGDTYESKTDLGVNRHDAFDYAAPDEQQQRLDEASERAKETIERGLFNSALDREIATTVLGDLRLTFERGMISEQDYFDAVDALQALVPVDNGKGHRQIDGKTIPPALEERIASRLESAEVDVAAPDGSWGKIPDDVKDIIASQGPTILEPTSHCTVGCAFCGTAQFGPIESKMSYGSATKVINDIAARRIRDSTGQNRQENDVLYWGTEPFDAKWKMPDGSDKDYTDLAAEHRRANANTGRSLFTTTSVPIGEEFRVLRYVRDLINTPGTQRNELFFSITTANSGRLKRIDTILDALDPNGLCSTGFNHSSDVSFPRTEKAWQKLEDKTIVHASEIIGQNCLDGTVIGVRGVDSITMLGGSPSCISGELRRPIKTVEDGLDVYRVPVYCFRPRLDGRDNPSDIYPDAQTIKITKNFDRTDTVIETDSDNPSRHLLRLAGAVMHYKARIGYVVYMPSRIVDEFRAQFGNTYNRLRAHVESGGTNDHIMRKFLVGIGLSGFMGKDID